MEHSSTLTFLLTLFLDRLRRRRRLTTLGNGTLPALGLEANTPTLPTWLLEYLMGITLAPSHLL